MFEKIKEKRRIKQIDKLLSLLETIDYPNAKHEMLKARWEALKIGDEESYEVAGTFWEVLDKFEKIYGNKEDVYVCGSDKRI